MAPRPFSPHRAFLMIAPVLVIAFAFGDRLPAAPAQAAGVIYVVPGGTGDGSSWASASNLARALTEATSGDELWIAASRYTPTTGADRRAAFVIKPGVALYGGFAGGETAREQRDWRANVTTLSGDLAGDDGPGFANSADNSFQVVSSASGLYTSDAFRIDGVTISGGNASGDPNLSLDKGGGLYLATGNVTLANVTFGANQATYGGAIYALASSLTLTDVALSGNRAAMAGGGILNESSRATMTNVIFRGNSATDYGGALSENGTTSTFTNVVFSGNSGALGGAISTMNGRQVHTNVTISGNSASFGGGALYVFNGEQRLRNSIIWGSGDTIFQDTRQPNTLTITHSIVQGGFEGAGNLNSDPRFAAPPPSTVSTAGDLRLQTDSPAINAGDNTGVSDTDLDGNPRIVGGIVDMGAYEALLAVRSIAWASPSPTRAATVDLAVTFTLPVSGVDVADFAVNTSGAQEGAQVTSVTGSGAIRMVTVTTVAGGKGAISLQVRDDDSITSSAGPLGGPGAGNGVAEGAPLVVDREAPALALAGQAPITLLNAASYPVLGSCTTGEGEVVVSVEGLRAATPCDEGAFGVALDVRGLADGADIDLVAAQTDALGNRGVSGAVILKDTVSPRVLLSTSAADPTSANPIPVNLTFSEAVSGFTVDDLVAVNGTIRLLSGGGASYSLAVTPLADGPVIIALVAGAAHDGVGNPSDAQSLARVFDGRPPAVLRLVGGPPTAGAPRYTFSTVLSDTGGLDLAGLGDGDVTVRGPRGYEAAATLLGSAPGADGTTLVTFAIPAPEGRWSSTANGVYVVRLAAGAIADKAGNVAPATELGSFTVALWDRVWLPLIIGAVPSAGWGQSLPPGF